VAGYGIMKLNWIVLALTVLAFVIAGLLIMYDQYNRIGVWFQMADLHHETFALFAFGLSIGTVIGAVIKK